MNEGGKKDGIYLTTTDRSINDSKIADLRAATTTLIVPEKTPCTERLNRIQRAYIARKRALYHSIVFLDETIGTKRVAWIKCK
ncbi:MAG: hypothetical protein CFH06_02057 [Alphaproteobacteria bacterium MarineAlpha3_Bin5]|nr:MAG: hypothetical protein CFH06_02057 [Alphaproteobacteria bacterium MarineAlpha3_Bin5]|tara:strand:+ start:592 stop:840 length:249 start_codon:yes stop_codon:yes gene_type:complete